MPGHYYTTNWFSSVISEWDREANLVGTLTLPSSLATDLRGMAFGQDGLLYVVAGIIPTPYRVLALNSSGQVMQTYPLDNEILGNTGYGKIAIGRGGQIFVAGGGHVCRFQIGDPSSATSLFPGTNTYDIKATPGGSLLAAESSQIRETSSDGGVFITFNGQGSLSNVRGVAFHLKTFKLFVNDLGDSGFPFHAARYDYTSGMLETSLPRNYPDGLLVDEDGNLLIGSGTLPPILTTRDFALLQTFGVSPQQFVAQCPSTPASVSLSIEFLTIFQNQVSLRWLDRSLRTWTLQYCEDLRSRPVANDR